MQNAIEPDSTFRTGKEWAGVWTRDISYSIILSMGILQPKVAMISLKKKVKNGKIIQDTGTGGAYPISTDRQIWAVAAWEVYKVTGDTNWLRYAYEVIKNSINDDLQNIHDPETGMVKGESSFWFNKQGFIKDKLEWQDEYFAVSVSQSILNTVRNYIKNQEEHHKKKTFQREYEEFIERYNFQKVPLW